MSKYFNVSRKHYMPYMRLMYYTIFLLLNSNNSLSLNGIVSFTRPSMFVYIKLKVVFIGMHVLVKEYIKIVCLKNIAYGSDVQNDEI